ncbi:hypothetical protein D6D19_08631 [Aureobasidium pullulans]|uniref:AB hydrolase-1 domain-containing protein n=1 Tax=Aureobasidium pullulans TaxID=5580 RepID=A0A4S8ZRW3_AURPU|nr:hypothetical protein D6D19_08631 [Aureobasidium pullulans]THY12961.1 hypothetical protein D6D00_10315 [Aureobasidium pullulans]
MSKPSIVLVPGAWHVPAHFSQVIEKLEDQGYVCVGVNLHTNTRNPLVDGRLLGIEDDVPAIRAAVTKQLDTGHDVVVVTHSYGTVPGTAALTGLNLKARRTANKTNGVVGVVIISGFILPPDSTMLTIMGGQLPPQYLLENNTTLPFAGPGAVSILYNDIDHNEALKAVWRLEPQSYGVNTSIIPDQVAGITGIPVSYLRCEHDRAVPLAVQDAAVEALREKGVHVFAEVAKSGHSPFLKMPEETARFIRKAGGEDIETGFSQFVG